MSTLEGLTYLVMPCSFRCGERSRGPGRFGDFDGLADSIGYLESLGVRTIMTTPPFPAVAYHGYQHSHPTSIDPRLGGDRAFSRFVETAHEAGMRVVIDFVAYGIDPRGLTDEERDDLAWENPSRTRATGYTSRTWNGRRVRFAHWNLRSARARSRVIEWAIRWLDKERPPSVDGLRLDHVWEQYPSDGQLRSDGLAAGSPPWAGGWGYHLSDFWTEFAERVKDVNPDATLIAEPADWSDPGDSLLSVFDAVLSKPLLFGLRHAVNQRDCDFESEPAIGALACSGDHDVDRLTSAVGDGPNRAALALLLLGKASPVVYAGDELGLRGRRLHRLGSDAGDLGRRGSMRWHRQQGWPDPDHASASPRAAAYLAALNRPGISMEEQGESVDSTLSLVRSLSEMRRKYPSIAAGSRQPIPAPFGVCARRCSLNGEVVDVWVNLTDKPIASTPGGPALGEFGARVEVQEMG